MGKTVTSAEPTLDALDQALTTHGYRRTGAWRKRVTAAGAVWWFTNAHTRIEDIDL